MPGRVHGWGPAGLMLPSGLRRRAVAWMLVRAARHPKPAFTWHRIAFTSLRRNIGCLQHDARTLDTRYAHQSDGTPGSTRWRFRRSETMCGQGRGRTADLPRFSGIRITAGQSTCAEPACHLRDTSVLDHDGLREPCRAAVRGEIRQCRGNLSVAPVNGMKVAVGRSGR
jgi:hypothetical protein